MGSLAAWPPAFGFAITVASIQIIPWGGIGWVVETIGWRWAFLPLGIGPLIGLYFVSKLPRDQSVRDQ